MNTKNITPGTLDGQHVAGTPLTTTATAAVAPSLLRNAIDERIARVRPMATPIDQISRSIGSRSCGSMTVEYYAVDARAAETTLKRPVNSSAPLTPDDHDNYTLTVHLTDTRILAVSDTVLFPGVPAEGGDLTAYVSEIIDQEKATLVLLNLKTEGSSAPTPALAQEQRVVRMGRAAGELDVQTGQFQAMPRKRSNHCQIFKMQIEQSTLQKISAKEVDWNFNDQEEAAIIDMRLGMEKNFLFGSRAVIRSPRNDEHVYFTGGIWNQTTQQLNVNLDNLDERSLLDICAKVFTGNNGSKKRILMGGTDLVLALNKISFSRAVDADSSLTRWGIRFREIVSNFGTLYVVHSEVFDKCGHRGDGFVIDPDYITKYTHIPFNKERIDLRRAGDRNTDAVVLTEASCVVLRHPDVHMRLVGTSASSSAGTPFAQQQQGGEA